MAIELYQKACVHRWY